LATGKSGLWSRRGVNGVTVAAQTGGQFNFSQPIRDKKYFAEQQKSLTARSVLAE
jgi:hypothetical protein